MKPFFIKITIIIEYNEILVEIKKTITVKLFKYFSFQIIYNINF